MQTDPAYLEFLRTRYAFAEWRTPDAADAVQDLEGMSGKELPGWTLRRATRQQGLDGVRLVRSIWATAAGGEDRLLDVEVWLCASPTEARTVLLSVLGDMQGPVGSRVTDGAPGDVAFRLGGDSALAFARGRAVVRIRNAGRQVVPVTAEAAAIDGWLLGKGRGR